VDWQHSDPDVAEVLGVAARIFTSRVKKLMILPPVIRLNGFTRFKSRPA